MKSKRVACLAVFVTLTCVGLALVATAPGQPPSSSSDAIRPAAASEPAAPAAAQNAAAAPAASSEAAPGGTTTQPANKARSAAATPAVPDNAAAPAGASTRPPTARTSTGVARPARAATTESAPPAASTGVSRPASTNAYGGRGGGGRYGAAYSSMGVPGMGPAGMGVDPETAKRMQEAFQAEAEQGQLLAKYTQTTDAKERAEIKASLAKVLQNLFDLQLWQREREVSEVEARVKKLREAIDKRKAAKEAIVNTRLDQLLNEADGMGWVSPTGGMPAAYGGFPGALPGYRVPSTTDPFSGPAATPVQPSPSAPSSNPTKSETSPRR